MQTFSKTEEWKRKLGKRNICQTTGKSKTDDSNTANHRRAQNDNREVRVLLCALRFVYYHFRRRLLSFWEALWGICGIYAEYSWSIHGIYVCIGYVSGMYRVCIGKVSKGTGSVGGYG